MKKNIFKISAIALAIVGFVMIFLNQYDMILLGEEYYFVMGEPDTILASGALAKLAYIFAIITFVTLFVLLIFAILQMCGVKGLGKVYEWLGLGAIIVAFFSILSFAMSLSFVISKNADAGKVVLKLLAPNIIMFVSTLASSALIFVEQRFVK